MKQLYLISLLTLCAIFNITAQKSVVLEGEFVVQLHENYTLDFFRPTHSRNALKVSSLKYLSVPLNIIYLEFDKELYDNSVLEKYLETHPAVKYFQQNRTVDLREVSNDEHFDKQLDLELIDIQKAWSVTTGGKTALGDEIVVAILDSGYDTELADLAGNIHLNNDEKEGDSNGDGCPGICDEDDDLDGLVDEDANGYVPGDLFYNPNMEGDDDENGYIDDMNGLNLKDKTDTHPALNHGTAVAGIIGAVGNNNIGVSGINWDVNLMVLSNVTRLDEIIEGYNYILEKRRLYNETDGLKGDYIVATNFSSGIDDEFGYSFPIWCSLYDALGEQGVLSVSATSNRNIDIDIVGDMPSTCTSPYLVVVTNTTLSDNMVGGFGGINVDLAAPGNGTFTLELGEIDNVGTFSGTSAASPHVAGAIALLHSIPCEDFARYMKENPTKVLELKDKLMSSTVKLVEQNGETVSNGRLNIFNAMLELKSYCPGSGGDLEITNIYPNPSFRERIKIEYDAPDGMDNFEFLVFDVMGRKRYSKTFNPTLYGEKFLYFEPPHLASGTYFFIIKNDTDLVARKHIIIPGIE